MQTIFTDDEKDILQEIMNIAFGNATADLAEVVDIYVNLNVPVIDVINLGAIPEYLKNTMSITDKSSMIIQDFHGNLNGSGLLVFPDMTGNDFKTILAAKGEEEDDFDYEQIISAENEMLVEIGNVLIGACVGKISELLNTSVNYHPPRLISGNGGEFEQFMASRDPNHTAIVMKTVFAFREENVRGYLLLLTNQESIEWLRRSLHEFLEAYEE